MLPRGPLTHTIYKLLTVAMSHHYNSLDMEEGLSLEIVHSHACSKQRSHPSAPDVQLRVAASRGKLHEVRTLLANGAGLSKDFNGMNALHHAAKWGHTNVLKYLLTTGRCKVNSQDKYGWSALHWASWNGHISTILALLNSDHCQVNLVDKTGSNPLHGAAINGHAGVVRVLSPVKCDIDLQRKDGWTPLHLASWNGHYDVARELISAKCQLNIKNEGGSGALHVAAIMGHDEIAQELLDGGAAPDMQDRTGNTALHEAVRWRHGGVVKILMSSDCRINIRNEQGHTPMDMARRDGFNEIVALLTGLEDCDLQPGGNCNCAELRRILFQAPEETDQSLKADDLKKLKWTGKDGEKIANHIEEKIRRTSETRLMQIEKEWNEKVSMARSEALAHCEARIAEVERQCRAKVAAIEQRCQKKLKNLMGRENLQQFNTLS